MHQLSCSSNCFRRPDVIRLPLWQVLYFTHVLLVTRLVLSASWLNHRRFAPIALAALGAKLNGYFNWLSCGYEICVFRWLLMGKSTEHIVVAGFHLPLHLSQRILLTLLYSEWNSEILYRGLICLWYTKRIPISIYSGTQCLTHDPGHWRIMSIPWNIHTALLTC